MLHDRQYSSRKIARNLKLSHESVYSILMDILGMKRVAAQKSRWCLLFSSIFLVQYITNSFQRDRRSIKNTIWLYWSVWVRKSLRNGQICGRAIRRFYTTTMRHHIKRQLWLNLRPKTPQIPSINPRIHPIAPRVTSFCSWNKIAAPGFLFWLDWSHETGFVEGAESHTVKCL